MHSLTKQLGVFFDALLERLDPASRVILLRPAQPRPELNDGLQPITAGDMAPDFVLPDQDGKMVSLAALRAAGPVVVVFVRGGWCPFCTMTLRAMDRIQPQLRRAGASLLAISPQSEPESERTVMRNGLRFPLLVDAGNAVARRFGLVWELDADRQALYTRLGHDLPRINPGADWQLPLTAGYVIAPDGRVVTAHVDARVQSRLEPSDALAAVRALKPVPAGTD